MSAYYANGEGSNFHSLWIVFNSGSITYKTLEMPWKTDDQAECESCLDRKVGWNKQCGFVSAYAAIFVNSSTTQLEPQGNCEPQIFSSQAHIFVHILDHTIKIGVVLLGG